MSHWVSSEIAASYRAFRPRYPEKLFERISQIYQVSALTSSSKMSGKSANDKNNNNNNSNSPNLILDIGTGSGQAIEGLLKVFPPTSTRRYIGVDPSEAQLEEARKEFAHFKDSIVFVQGDAGSSEAGHLQQKISSSSHQHQQQQVDLVVVAQALHWINIKNFANHLLLSSPGAASSSSSTLPLLNQDTGMVAAWLYSTNRVTSSKECDKILDDFDKMLLNQGFWPEGRWSIENLYENQIVDFKRNGFDFVAKEVISDERELSLESFVQYLNTWSGVQKYEREKGLERGAAIEEAIRKPFLEVLKKGDSTWKDGAGALRVRYDFHLFVFKPSRSNKSGHNNNFVASKI